MKILRNTALFLSILISISCTTQNTVIKVMTLNIRYDNKWDSINAWPHRAAMVASFTKSQQPDLLGMQEVLWHQYEFLDSALTGYGSVAVGRDDGIHAGEACPVFYRLARFNAVKDGTFWLSATPEIPGSVGWGAALTRIATWVKLTDKITGDTILFMNTHFDHISDSARVMSAKVLLQKIKELSGNNKFVITGDFNALPESLAIKTIISEGIAKDTYLISEERPQGKDYTFNGFHDEKSKERIDYIYVRNGMEVKEHSTLEIKQANIFISDHWPVIAEVK
jgi:endonuclease/exonuclease/phosphatase family metal-dependent hydrolase